MSENRLPPRAVPPTRSGAGFRPLGLSRDNALLALSMLLAGAGLGFYQYILPLYASSLGASPDEVGLTLAIGNSGSVVGVLAGGLFVNRFSYRKQLVLGWLLAIPAYGLFVVAPSWEVVALASFVDWLSLLVLPAFNAYIGLARDGQEPAEAFTTIYSSLTAGMAITPALGGFLTATLGLRAPFVAALVCATVSWLCVLLLRERTHRREEEVSRASTGRGLARLARPFRTYTAALENRAFRDLLVVLAVIYVSTFIGVSLLPNYLHDRNGIGPAVVGVFGSLASAVAVGASLVLGRLSHRLGVFRTLALAQILILGGLLLVLLASGMGGYVLLASGVGFALRGGSQAQQSLTRGTIAAVVAEASTGPAFALQSTLFNLAQVLGPALAGVLYVRDPGLPLLLALGIGIPVVVWLVITSHRASPVPARV